MVYECTLYRPGLWRLRHQRPQQAHHLALDCDGGEATSSEQSGCC